MKFANKWLFVAALLVGSGCDAVDRTSGPEVTAELQALTAQAAASPGVRTMTMNMYVGFDLMPLMTTPPAQIPMAAAAGWADVVENRPTARIAAMANEIAVVRPHLIGLQEVTTIRTQFPADSVLGVAAPNAQVVYVDYLATLQQELAKRGQVYVVAASKTGTDVEAPRFDGVSGATPLFTDVRLTFADVILRRVDVTTEPLFAINYAVALPLPFVPGTRAERNALAVVAKVGGRTFRFVSTHLEPLIPGLPDNMQVQYAQAGQLIQMLATGFRPELPTIAVGDFNTQAGTGLTYQMMAGAGFTDSWTVRDGWPYEGFTCCQEPVLDGADSVLDERIDYVWVKGAALKGPVFVFTLGDNLLWKTLSLPRLWPSDHAAVAAWLLF